MSIQLTLARAAFRAAEADWKDHVRHCPRCCRAARSRHWDSLCGAGTSRRQDLRDTRSAVEQERELDKAPMPGQEPLW